VGRSVCGFDQIDDRSGRESKVSTPCFHEMLDPEILDLREDDKHRRPLYLSQSTSYSCPVWQGPPGTRHTHLTRAALRLAHSLSPARISADAPSHRPHHVSSSAFLDFTMSRAQHSSTSPCLELSISRLHHVSSSAFLDFTISQAHHVVSSSPCLDLHANSIYIPVSVSRDSSTI